MSDAPQSVPGSSMTRDEIDAAIEANERAVAAKRQSKLLRIVDEIDTVRGLMDAAWMAADSLTPGEGGPIMSVLCVAHDKLTAARDALNELRGAPAEDESGGED
jgi:hypothetical protein